MVSLGLPTRIVSLLLPQEINISPNSNGLPGIGQLRSIVGASMTIGLILAVLALIISAVVWLFDSLAVGLLRSAATTAVQRGVQACGQARRADVRSAGLE
jgi:hypothetical protein